jgi:uncharacterized membrane protein YraQ (UPF0718 family)
MYEFMEALFSFGPYRVAVLSCEMFLRLWYFLAIGIIIGAAFNVFVPPAKMSWMSRNAGDMRAIFIAALLGAVSPLGSYAVIPIFVTLLGIGIPLAPVMTFLTASPLVNPFIFVITLQLFGWKMAIARLLSALIVGVVIGLIFKYLARFRSFQNTSSALICPELGRSSHTSLDATQNADGPDARFDRFLTPVNHHPGMNKWKTFLTQCLKMTRQPGKWFAVSIILAAVVDVYIPTDWIVRFLGGHSYSLLLAAAMAIPFYVCGGGAAPLVWNLMRTGMDQGAALSFFIAGPMTRIAPMLTVIALVKFKAFGVYFAISIVMAIVLGFLYHYV